MQHGTTPTKPIFVHGHAGRGRTAVAQARLVLLVMVNVAQLWILAATVEAALAHRFSALLPLVVASGICFVVYAYADFLVASRVALFHQLRLLETMKNPVESLLEGDHESLGQLLTELDAELAKQNIARAFELLDLFWARLAVHIRAENLHLFPALADAPASLFTGKAVCRHLKRRKMCSRVCALITIFS